MIMPVVSPYNDLRAFVRFGDSKHNFFRLANNFTSYHLVKDHCAISTAGVSLL